MNIPRLNYKHRGLVRGARPSREVVIRLIHGYATALEPVQLFSEGALLFDSQKLATEYTGDFPKKLLKVREHTRDLEVSRVTKKKPYLTGHSETTDEEQYAASLEGEQTHSTHQADTDEFSLAISFKEGVRGYIIPFEDKFLTLEGSRGLASVELYQYDTYPELDIVTPGYAFGAINEAINKSPYAFVKSLLTQNTRSIRASMGPIKFDRDYSIADFDYFEQEIYSKEVVQSAKLVSYLRGVVPEDSPLELVGPIHSIEYFEGSELPEPSSIAVTIEPYK